MLRGSPSKQEPHASSEEHHWINGVGAARGPRGDFRHHLRGAEGRPAPQEAQSRSSSVANPVAQPHGPQFFSVRTRA